MSPVSGSGIEILFIGDDTWPEFADVADWLMDQNVTVVNTVEAALARLQSDLKPALIAISQPWPGHVSSKQVDSLRRAAPLARIVSLLGTWTEGEVRTGRPWPAVARTYWHAWLPRLAAEFHKLAAGKETVWSLPTTMGDDERLLNWRPWEQSPPAQGKQSKTILLVSTSRDTAESLGDICRPQGWGTIWRTSITKDVDFLVDLVVVDCRNLGAADLREIANIRLQIAESNLRFSAPGNCSTTPPPILVIAGFPRIADVEHLQSLGVAAVVSKPFMASDLIWQIEQFWQ